MAITYPVDIEATQGRWSIHDTSTGETVKMSGGSGNWPNGDGTEILGLGANLIPLLGVEDAKPEIDTRLHRLEGTPTIDLPNNEILTTWAIVARSNEEKTGVVENIENDEFSKHFDFNRMTVENTLMITALLRSMQNLNVPEEMLGFVTAYQTKGEKIYNNRLQINAWLDQIENGETPNFDGVTFEPVE